LPDNACRVFWKDLGWLTKFLFYHREPR